MFCGKCGHENEEDAVFCTECGARLDGGASASFIGAETVAVNVSADAKNRKIGMIAVAAAAIVLIAFGTFVFGGRSYKKTIALYVEYSNKLDMEAICDKLVPSKIIDYMNEKDGISRSEYRKGIKQMEKEMEESIEEIEKQYDVKWKNCKVTYEITDMEALKGDELDDIKETYKEDIGLKVSAAKQGEIEITIKIDDDNETTTSLDISLVKAGRNWYLDLVNMGDLF